MPEGAHFVEVTIAMRQIAQLKTLMRFDYFVSVHIHAEVC